MQKNPFILEPFRSKEYFCDRERESAPTKAPIPMNRVQNYIIPAGSLPGALAVLLAVLISKKYVFTISGQR